MKSHTSLPGATRSRLCGFMLALSVLGVLGAQRILTGAGQAELYAPIQWHGSTNGLVVGTCLPCLADIGKKGRLLCEVYLTWKGTNSPPRVFLPRMDQRFALALLDPAKSEVGPTKAGRSFGKMPPTSVTVGEALTRWGWRGGRTDWREMRVSGGHCTQVGYFDLADVFALKKAGRHRLTIEPRVFSPNSNGVLCLVPLPIVALDVDIRYGDLESRNGN